MRNRTRLCNLLYLFLVAGLRSEYTVGMQRMTGVTMISILSCSIHYAVRDIV